MRVLAIVSVLFFAAPAGAQQHFASMSADQAYVRAVAYMQGEFSRLRDENHETKARLLAAETELKILRDKARADDGNARFVLTAFAAGDGAQGVDAMVAGAAAQPQATASEAAQKAQAFKAAGALAFAVDTARAAAAYEAALSLSPTDKDALRQLWWLYYRLGRYDDADGLAQRLAGSADPDSRAMGLWALGRIARERGDLVRAEASFKAGLDIAQNAGLKRREAEILGGLGIVAYRRDDADAAEDYLTRALALDTELGDLDRQARDHGDLGLIDMMRNDLAGAETKMKRSLALHVRTGSLEGQATLLTALGNLELQKGDAAEAETYFKRAFALNTRIQDKTGISTSHNNFGYLAERRGNIEAACGHYRTALALQEEIGAGQSPYAAYARERLAAICPR